MVAGDVFVLFWGMGDALTGLCVFQAVCVPGAPSGLCVCQVLILSTRFASCHQMDKVKTLFH